MAQISLRAYVEYIEDRLARDALTEVVAQCRHVLGSYPKFIDVYRLLARALMEQEKNQDALDLFQRVLSADPNDFVAHIGISEVYHETGSLDQAIWHLERAYEQAPSNIDLQEAVKDLYAERDGQAPRKIHLTGGALARMYANGKLYDQALLELRKALAGDPERLDLLVLMANTLWNYHQYVEAGKLAGKIRQRLPNSIDANALLARMWLQFGKAAEAQPFLNTVKQLDPYLSYEIEQGEDAPSDAFKLLMLDYTADRHATEIGAADWVSEIGAIAKERGVTGPLPAEAMPELEPRSSITDIFGQAEPEPTPAQTQQESPEWLSEALASTSSPAEMEGYSPAEQPPPLPPDQPDWLSEALGSAGVITQPTEDTAPSQNTLPATELEEKPEPVPESFEPQMSAPASDAPDWMQEVLGSAASPAPPSPVEGSDEVPDWLHEVGLAPASEPSISPPADSGDMPDWLAETLGQPAAQAEVLSDTAGSDMPDWLAETLGSEQTPIEETTSEWQAERLDNEFEVEASTPDSLPFVSDEPVPDLMDDLPANRDAPDWLDDILSGEPEDAIATAQAGQVPAEVVSDDWLDDFLGGEIPDTEAQVEEDWMAELNGETAVEEISEPEPVYPVETVLPPGTLETWNQATERQSSGGTEPTALASAPRETGEQSDELPDWLSTGTVSKIASTDESDEAGENLPDWLAAAKPLVSDEEQSASEDAGSLPDWLAEAASPSDESESEEQSADEDNSLPDWLQGGSS